MTSKIQELQPYQVQQCWIHRNRLKLRTRTTRTRTGAGIDPRATATAASRRPSSCALAVTRVEPAAADVGVAAATSRRPLTRRSWFETVSAGERECLENFLFS